MAKMSVRVPKLAVEHVTRMAARRLIDILQRHNREFGTDEYKKGSDEWIQHKILNTTCTRLGEAKPIKDDPDYVMINLRRREIRYWEKQLNNVIRTIGEVTVPGYEARARDTKLVKERRKYEEYIERALDTQKALEEFLGAILEYL